MASKVKENKKINKKHPRRKEVEIPVFVISKKESPGFKKHFSGLEDGVMESFRIARDEDDLPVLEKRVSVPTGGAEEKISEAEIDDEWQEIRNQAHQKNLAVAEAPKKGKKTTPLSENHKRTILWVSVTVIAAFIFFIWLYGLKNNFSEIFGSASYTFSRSANVLEGAGNNLGQLENQLSNLESDPGNQSAISAGQEIVDQIKEKILVEELKDKLAK